MTVLLLASLAFVLGTVGTGFARRYSISRDIYPNARSSHEIPVPRGGGVSIALVWAVALPVIVIWCEIGLGVTVALAAPLLIALVGWIDDHQHLSPGVRITAHSCSAIVAVVALGGVPEVDLGPFALSFGLFPEVATVLGLVWLTNLFNFMDGVDGFAGTEAVMVAGTQVGILTLAGSYGVANMAAVLAGASAGFLVWNWPPARVFMGDVGSGFLGSALGVLAVVGQTEHGIPLPLLLLPMGVFILDATYTLIRRLLRGEVLHEAHHSHVYQQLAQAGWSHRDLTVTVLVMNTLLILLAFVGWFEPAWILGLLAGGVVGVTTVSIVAVRRSRC